VNLDKIKRNHNTWVILEMACKRCVGHAINVPSASPTSLTSNVGIGTSASASLTSLTTTLAKSSPSGIVWSVEDMENTLPIATNWGGSPTNNLHRYEVSVLVSSSSSSSAAQLPFVLALPCIGTITASCKGVCCCCYDNSSNSLLICCLSSSFIWEVNSSLIWDLNSSLIRDISMAIFVFWDELDLGIEPKYCLTPTPYPAVHTRPGCSSVPRAVVNISFLPWTTKLPWKLCPPENLEKKNITQYINIV